jgi:hypothetical protein
LTSEWTTQKAAKSKQQKTQQNNQQESKNQGKKTVQEIAKRVREISPGTNATVQKQKLTTLSRRPESHDTRRAELHNIHMELLGRRQIPFVLSENHWCHSQQNSRRR